MQHREGGDKGVVMSNEFSEKSTYFLHKKALLVRCFATKHLYKFSPDASHLMASCKMPVEKLLM